MLLKNQQIMKEEKGNKNMDKNKWKWKHDNPKSMGFSKSSAKGKVHSNTSIPQETRIKSNKPNSTPKATRKGKNEEHQG